MKTENVSADFVPNRDPERVEMWRCSTCGELHEEREDARSCGGGGVAEFPPNVLKPGDVVVYEHVPANMIGRPEMPMSQRGIGTPWVAGPTDRTTGCAPAFGVVLAFRRGPEPHTVDVVIGTREYARAIDCGLSREYRRHVGVLRFPLAPAGESSPLNFHEFVKVFEMPDDVRGYAAVMVSDYEEATR